MDEFSKLLMKERKQLQALSQLEAKREACVEKVFQQLAIQTEDKTVTVLLEYVKNEEEKKQLEMAVAELVDVIVEIREVEQLNNELIQQSMEFVQLSLEMLQPSMKNMNYNQNNQTQNTQNNNSVFDSKA